MPHFILEYTDNLSEEANIRELLRKIHEVLISRSDLFPIGGIRSRAIPLKEYYVADGTEDDAFVHGTLKIGAGRSEEDKRAVCEEIFRVMKEHFAPLFEKRYLALSLELYEFSEAGTYKHNNIHQRYRKR
ncbi:5-carboxymethyl-2-hydroxymuconate Delta-isomerase [Parageobacillus sp. VR-IP]|jgi:5-carboxymethyl-2-hydroxymuconate isomerase|uniref:5-carboxymethyl-2-hydroxymuconate delta-isomerase n=2 Tax=Saccharococcus caldoxylosilyticus TaxID=81408 RepID=A0A150L630_9BACL|nr:MULTISPECIES: 5-carboxymethyl-2-hydroxymuconate Delta-isomerase [Parageobacillus]OQP04848.1 5-carboxymethyl-2-hydroxymuconate isomerase [Geobacillus sp. 44B]KYD07735.1 5-carboxymethyl-2-hydroxymuconate delta-isomerase [Parageobacillus caldoxylosilyticus]NUK29662.1 5-carboxymethyl-2-hydroxymuconate Delta-isomerase [Parageobacillus sp. VR-IP]QNU39099.1 5-carboxymethyl-2-hydroxymuconate Delta-isomerase [Geobacillus sp. 44B]QXJ38940.1 5-carboxymethyl-2-hydroxymuconate Delta-isomerase [Parageoba